MAKWKSKLSLLIGILAALSIFLCVLYLALYRPDSDEYEETLRRIRAALDAVPNFYVTNFSSGKVFAEDNQTLVFITCETEQYTKTWVRRLIPSIREWLMSHADSLATGQVIMVTIDHRNTPSEDYQRIVNIVDREKSTYNINVGYRSSTMPR